jgi:hypothetical protein
LIVNIAKTLFKEIKLFEAMENEIKVKSNENIETEDGNVNATLLKNLIKSVGIFLDKKKENPELFECIKRIFFSGLRVFDKNVSNCQFELHQNVTPIVIKMQFAIIVFFFLHAFKYSVNIFARQRIPSIALLSVVIYM